MDATLALLIIALVYAIGDVVSAKTKAVLSMLFVAGIIFLVGFWFGLPKTLFDDSNAFAFAIAVIPMLMAHMGSLLNVQELKEEWKTVLIVLFALIAVALLLFIVGAPLFGKQYAIAAAGPITGGVVATLIMQEALTAMGLDTIVVFATLLLVLQSFVGLPIASTCLSREAKRLLRDRDSVSTDKSEKNQSVYKPKWRLLSDAPKSMQTAFILIAKAMLVGWLGVQAAHLLNDVINKYVMALIFGIVFTEIGFLDRKVLDKAGSTGLALFVLLIPVFHSLPNATPAMVVSLIVPIVLSFLIASVAIVAITFILSRLFKYSWALSMAIGFSCMFGFPGTFIISEEVTKAQAGSEEERDYLLAHILPKMLVAGFTTVTIASVIIAGLLVKFL